MVVGGFVGAYILYVFQSVDQTSTPSFSPSLQHDGGITRAAAQMCRSGLLEHSSRKTNQNS